MGQTGRADDTGGNKLSGDLGVGAPRDERVRTGQACVDAWEQTQSHARRRVGAHRQEEGLPAMHAVMAAADRTRFDPAGRHGRALDTSQLATTV